MFKTPTSCRHQDRILFSISQEVQLSLTTICHYTLLTISIYGFVYVLSHYDITTTLLVKIKIIFSMFPYWCICIVFLFIYIDILYNYFRVMFSTFIIVVIVSQSPLLHLYILKPYTFFKNSRILPENIQPNTFRLSLVFLIGFFFWLLYFLLFP